MQEIQDPNSPRTCSIYQEGYGGLEEYIPRSDEPPSSLLQPIRQTLELCVRAAVPVTKTDGTMVEPIEPNTRANMTEPMLTALEKEDG